MKKLKSGRSSNFAKVADLRAGGVWRKKEGLIQGGPGTHSGAGPRPWHSLATPTPAIVGHGGGQGTGLGVASPPAAAQELTGPLAESVQPMGGGAFKTEDVPVESFRSSPD